MTARPRLILLSGLPGTGKTTLSTGLAAATGAVPLRVDTIETALARTGAMRLTEGYEVSFDLARDYLGLGRDVIADMVNNGAWERQRWDRVAAETGAVLIPVEVICSDRTAHRHRIAARRSQSPEAGHPDWAAVCARGFQPWDRCRVLIDTAKAAPAQALATLIAALTRWPDAG